jgi:hypothetical protein
MKAATTAVFTGQNSFANDAPPLRECRAIANEPNGRKQRIVLRQRG